MNILQSWVEEVKGQSASSKFEDFFRPRVWGRIRKHRDQRLRRGFSDQDMWGGGEHIMQIISDSLKWYETDSMADWRDTFKRWREEGTDFGYKSLKQVYSDIDKYLELEQQGWPTGLDVDTSDIETDYIQTNSDSVQSEESNWVDTKTGKRLSKKQVSRRIVTHYEKVDRAYGKAVNAMTFWANHAREFWD